MRQKKPKICSPKAKVYDGKPSNIFNIIAKIIAQLFVEKQRRVSFLKKFRTDRDSFLLLFSDAQSFILFDGYGIHSIKRIFELDDDDDNNKTKTTGTTIENQNYIFLLVKIKRKTYPPKKPSK